MFKRMIMLLFVLCFSIAVKAQSKEEIPLNLSNEVYIKIDSLSIYEKPLELKCLKGNSFSKKQLLTPEKA